MRCSNLSVENTNEKIVEKIRVAKEALVAAPNDALLQELTTLEENYYHTVMGVLSEYYLGQVEAAREYQQLVARENFSANINIILERIKAHTPSSAVDSALRVHLKFNIEKDNTDNCGGCGERYITMPELSEMHCPGCGKVKTLVGTIFRDEQFYTQDGQKSRHSGYDTNRHYRFWIERLQATENKSITAEMRDKIEYVLTRDDVPRKTLTCEKMRAVLKDPCVALTKLNEHVPLLVKMFGGPAPPQLTYQDHQLLTLRFGKVMALYDVVNPRAGNKPYYPYFIYKIIEHEFRDNPEKLAVLNFIHLQSRDTVIKNDRIYEKICARSDGELHYCPTDVSRC